MAETKLYASLGLMIVGGLGMTVLSDIIEPGPLALALAGGGGLIFLAGGLWQLQLADDRDRTDERYLQIGLRASTLSFWALLVGLMTFSNVEDVYDVTYPVLSNYSWLLIVGMVVFVTASAWYGRRM